MQTTPEVGDEFVAISCVNVGVGPGGTTSMLARVALVDYKGHVLLDHYVQPTPGVTLTDCRTASTGITYEDLYSDNSLSFSEVQMKVGKMVKGKILVGYCIWNDLSVLGMSHPAVHTRDVGLYQPFRNALRSPNTIIRLPTLAWTLLNRRCSEGLLNPVEMARAAIDIYRSAAEDWENAITNRNWPSALPPSTFSRCYY
ncbi:hypothetical protein BDN72DRAFT_30659 [Pluteus cervinus]|uniref:Uncharacterized protein n=1 Tax=Pluteus cervinus TaxID=181527 RepID=A0ACD3BGC8_9AGAR|nr:hypothetical protein BDN72DRAFT_30659 [Pluteus cervinus]